MKIAWVTYLGALSRLNAIPGAYEPPKAAKERVTCVPSKYKLKCGTGRGYPYNIMYVALAYSNRRALSIFGKYCA